MTIELGEAAIALTGTCGIEEVEALVGYLVSHPERPVDLSAATAIHTALWQALMVFKPNVIGSPTASAVAENLFPGLTAYFIESRQV
jgi:hypothetical protein